MVTGTGTSMFLPSAQPGASMVTPIYPASLGQTFHIGQTSATMAQAAKYGQVGMMGGTTSGFRPDRYGQPYLGAGGTANNAASRRAMGLSADEDDDEEQFIQRLAQALAGINQQAGQAVNAGQFQRALALQAMAGPAAPGRAGLARMMTWMLGHGLR